jgi:hypothetical protein
MLSPLISTPTFGTPIALNRDMHLIAFLALLLISTVAHAALIDPTLTPEQATSRPQPKPKSAGQGRR